MNRARCNLSPLNLLSLPLKNCCLHLDHGLKSPSRYGSAPLLQVRPSSPNSSQSSDQCTSYVQMATMCMSSDGMHAYIPELPLAGGICPTWRAGLRRVLRWTE